MKINLISNRTDIRQMLYSWKDIHTNANILQPLLLPFSLHQGLPWLLTGDQPLPFHINREGQLVLAYLFHCIIIRIGISQADYLTVCGFVFVWIASCSSCSIISFCFICKLFSHRERCSACSSFAFIPEFLYIMKTRSRPLSGMPLPGRLSRTHCIPC